MNETVSARVRWIMAGLVVGVGLVLVRLVGIQLGADGGYWDGVFQGVNRGERSFPAQRGHIFDRRGELMATNETEWRLSIDPPLVNDPAAVADTLSELVGRTWQDMYDAATSDAPRIFIASPVQPAVGEEIIARKKNPDAPDLSGISLDPLPQRNYPGGRLASHLLGFTAYDERGNYRGYYGVEEYYDGLLRGRSETTDALDVPFEVEPGPAPKDGADVYLTIDREIQFAVERALAEALRSSDAASGTIIVMDPRTGEILGMASAPDYDLNRFNDVNPEFRNDPAVAEQYEPGSVFKVVSMAAALDSQTVTPQTTYVDVGAIECGGATIRNWDGGAWGVQDMLGLLQHSLNVGMSWVVKLMGAPTFYRYLDAFNIGAPTGVDLAGEIGGELYHPGSSNWHESDLCTNSFGQGLAVTPLQLITAISAVANDGVMMQPHVLLKVADGQSVRATRPQALGRPISPETAHTLAAMLNVSLERETSSALVPGYRVVGKTGTAQIPIPGGYDPERTIASFIGWGPLENPRFIALIKLDAPTAAPWGSVVAAPVFSQLAQRLVVLLEIPPDETLPAP